MIKIFFRFSSLNSMFILPSLKLATQCWDAARASPGVAILASIYELPNLFSLRDTAIFEIFQKFSKKGNLKSFHKT